MFDKNGIEIKAGQIVEISGAYFKNDNGLYFIDCAPGDPNWTGKQCSLKKISKKGKISKAKRNICFWPISVFVNDLWKRAEADEWNREHATIEIKDGIDRAEVKAHFAQRAAETAESVKYYAQKWGEDNEVVKRYRKEIAHCEKLCASM